MIVMKFGGTSNQDAAAMRNVVRIVKSHLQERPLVVISAIARATNELEETARAAAAGREEEAAAIAARLVERHHAIVDNLITARTTAAELEALFYAHLAEIKALVKGLAILRELTPRTMDALCSHGERMSSRLVAAALGEQGVQAVWLDAKDFMITDDSFGHAQPLMELVTDHLHRTVRPLLDAGKTPVTQGFIGVTQTGAYTTMGRESSDYSASIIGAALDADMVQIWTDVDGILTADPSIVERPRKVNSMSFEEAFELSYFGAKVLHPNTMLPVLEKKIPVQILNSKREKSTGTMVNLSTSGTTPIPVLKSIAYRKGLSVITIVPRRRFNQYLFWEGIYSVLNKHRVASGLVATSEYSVALAVDRKAVADGLLHDLKELGRVQILEGKGSLCLVGHGMRERVGVATRIFSVFHDMPVSMISYGASEMNLTLVLDEDRIPDAVNRLHREFFEKVNDTEWFDATV